MAGLPGSALEPRAAEPAAQRANPWWKGAVIYQVYPRSFQDSNDDGIGDLPGLIQRLPYIASLGVDAIWVSPFFKSPQKDMGYDVSGYREVDPLFGTIGDCDLLISECHRMGMKIVFDVVLSHSSDQHQWFQDSRRRLNGRDDWYVWADPKADGSPPNNWMSMFGGPAWSFDPLRGQYYLHNFLEEQPDLNYHEPAVQDAMLDVVKFWLDRGVDGLRLDVVTFYFHDRQLRDNPPRPPEMGSALQFRHPDPYSMQKHLYDKSQPENLAFIERLRALTDSYDTPRMLMGEIGDDHPLARMAEYTFGDNRLHTAYSFALLAGTDDVTFTPDYVRKAVMDEIAASEEKTWPTWAFSNHDVPRSVSRLGPKHLSNTQWPKCLMALLLSLRGSICMYQGEELGLPEANVPYEKLQDPWGKHVWPNWQGRDGCRTPMPWNDAQPFAGFSNHEPWLPAAPEHQGYAVSAQESKDDSMLCFVRSFTKFRKQHDALMFGEIAFVDTSDSILAFTRSSDSESFLCVFNLSDAPVKFKLPFMSYDGTNGQLFHAGVEGGTLSLGEFGFAIIPASAASSSLAKVKSFWASAFSFLGSRIGSSVRHSKNA